MSDSDKNSLSLRADELGVDTDYDELDIDQELDRILKRLDEVSESIDPMDDLPASKASPSKPMVAARPQVPARTGQVDNEASTILLTERVEMERHTPLAAKIEVLDDFTDLMDGPAFSDSLAQKPLVRRVEPALARTVGQLTFEELSLLIERAVENGVRRALNK